MKGWLDKYQEGGNVAVSDATRTKFTKNTGLKKGVDQPVSNMLDITLSAPQRQLVKMITGKEQSPSEAMGIKNPYGAFAADAILDPTNLVGAGLLGKVAKASTKTGILSNAYKINPWAFKPNPKAAYRGIGKTGVQDAVNSGVFRQAGLESGVPRYNKVYYGSGNKGFATAKNYSKDFIAELPKNVFDTNLLEPNWSSSNLVTKEHIPINEGRILEKDWLRGYKPIEVPKKENGGWLDKYNDGGPVQPNYNDYNVSASPDFQGDGYSNVGRNYSPAWGGQFQDGGKVKPITVTDKNDPRLKAYQDSLSLYNLSNRLMRKATPYAPNYSFPANPILYEDYYVPYNSTGRYPDGNRSKLGLTKQENAIGIDFRKEVEKSLKTKNKPLGWAYGDVAVPVYKKPTQPIMYRPEPTPQSTIDFMEGNYAQEPITEIPQASAYGEVVDPRTGYTHMTRQGSSMYPMVGQNVPEMEEGGPVKRFMQPTETFKNYGYNPKENEMSTEYSTSIGGPGEVYLVPGYRQGRVLNDPEATFNMYGEHLGGPFKTVKAAEDFAQLRHKYVEQNKNIPAPFKTRDYAMGGALPGATGSMYARYSGGGSMPGDVDFRYPRTGSIPDNGKYAKKTKASAENGIEMQYYQNGLDWKPRSMAEGGEVVPGENEELQLPNPWDDNNRKTSIDQDSLMQQYAIGKLNRTPLSFINSLNASSDFPNPDSDDFSLNIDQTGAKHFINSVAPIETKNYIPNMGDKFDVMDEMYSKKDSQFSKNWYDQNQLDKPTNNVKLNTGRFRGAKVPTNIIDELAETSRKQNIPLGQLLTLMGRESTFGQEVGNRRGEDKVRLVSGWNVAEDYKPYDPVRFLADNKVPGIKPSATSHGYEYEITDERAMNNYLRKNPKLLNQYKAKLDSTKSLGDQDAFDLAARFLKKKGVKGYNPGDPNYTNAFNKDYDLLKQDKGLMKYVKQKGYTFEDGGSLELTKLDQLTNFTNYNTKQPGGWLDKYQ